MSRFSTPDNASGSNIALAHTIYGSPTTATMRPDSHGENIAPATWSTTPYKPPARRAKDNPDRSLCAFEGCRAFPAKAGGGDYCAGHGRKLGIVPTCLRAECCGAPYKGTLYCYHHQPKGPVSDNGNTG